MSKRERWLFIFLLTNLFIAGAVLVYLKKKPLCIESQYISEVIFNEQGKEFLVYSCQQNRDVPYVPRVEEQLNLINDRLENLEALLSQMFNPEAGTIKPIKLNLFADDFSYDQIGSEVRIGAALIDEPLILETAITKALLLNGESLKDFESEIISHFILEVGLPKPPVTEFIVDPPKKVRFWPQAGRTWTDYCRFGTILLSHYGLCRKSDQEKSINSQQISLYSLMDLWIYSLTESFKIVDVNKRMNFMKQLPDMGRQWASNKQNIERSLDSILFFGDFSEAKQDLLQQIENFRQILASKAHHEFADALRSQFDERGVFREEIVFDFVLLGNSGAIDSVEQRAKLERLSFRHPASRMLILKKDQMLLMPAAEGVALGSLTAFKAKRVVVMQCQRPSLKEIVGLKGLSSRVVWVKSCRPEESFLFTGFVVDGTESFARDNLEVPFYSYHIPSIELVLKKTSQVEKQTYERLFGWKSQDFDKTILAYRVKAVVEAIDFFRPEKD